MTTRTLLPAGKFLLAVLTCLALLPLLSGVAMAHAVSDSFMKLERIGEKFTGSWDIALTDLEAAIGIDTDKDGQLTWGELKEHRTHIERYVGERFGLASEDGDVCITTIDDMLVNRRSAGVYAHLNMSARCPVGTDWPLRIDYKFLFNVDAQHRGMVTLTDGASTETFVFSQAETGKAVDLRTPSMLRESYRFLLEGIWHIWMGADHIAFLLVLLLPAVRFRGEGTARFSVALVDVARVVTCFTVAHSVTLALVSLGYVKLPVPLVEATIAASVLVAALNNIFDVMPERRWLLALVFGLIHGCGFASVLADIGLPSANLLGSLAGFNIGVEIGQIAIVGVTLPLLYAMRSTLAYRHFVLVGGSAAAAVLAMLWIVDRVGGSQFMPF